MGVPEFVVMEGIRRAWRFLREKDFVLGMIAKELPLEKQEAYRATLREEEPSFVFQNSVLSPRLPVFGVSLMGESESPEGQFLNDDGPSFLDMPYPPEQPEDFDIYDDFKRYTYPSEESPKMPNVIGGGDVSRDDVRNNPLPRHNQVRQREAGDEQYDEMNHPYRAYHEDAQKLGFRVVGSTLNMGITVTTQNAEKTVLYTRLLLHVLRQWVSWFQIHGLINPTFSVSDLSIDESLSPIAGSPVGPFRRQITMSFFFTDQNLEVSKVLIGWVIDVGLATLNNQGGLDFTPISQTYVETVKNPLK